MTRSLYVLALMSLSTLVCGDAAPQAPTLPDYSFVQTIMMLALGMAFFYFILYRPEQKKRRELESAKESMKVGDRVIAVGLVGTVHKIQKDTVILKMVDDSKVEVIKAAITEVVAPTNAN